jgi:hypothetical protein
MKATLPALASSPSDPLFSQAVHTHFRVLCWMRRLDCRDFPWYSIRRNPISGDADRASRWRGPRRPQHRGLSAHAAVVATLFHRSRHASDFAPEEGACVWRACRHVARHVSCALPPSENPLLSTVNPLATQADGVADEAPWLHIILVGFAQFMGWVGFVAIEGSLSLIIVEAYGFTHSDVRDCLGAPT